MKREIGLATLYLGDSRELQLELTNKVIITDPVWPNAPEGMFEIDAPPDELMAEVLQLHLDAIRAVIVLRADSDPRFLAAVPAAWPFFRVTTMEYATPGYIGRKLGGLELAYQFLDPVKSRPGRKVIPNRAVIAQPGGCWKGHPCARNIQHMRWLVQWCSDPHETVFDPFMGSGTTGVAAVEQGRHFVGIEKVPAYFEDACLRIAEAQQQQRLSLQEGGAA